MARAKWINCMVIGVLCISVTGCAGLTVGKNPPRLESKPLLKGYMVYNGFRPYDGKILETGVLSKNDRWGDIVSLDLWPIGGVGVSFIGAKIKLLPFEIGFGVFGHDPEPESYSKEDKPGVSFTGAKIKLLPPEISFGVLGHDPEPESHPKEDEPEE